VSGSGGSTSSGGSSGQPCTDDSYEPNNSAADAKAITLSSNSTTTTVTGLKACDGEDDWFSFSVPRFKGVRVSLGFAHADSDLDLYLHTAADAVRALDSSTGTGDGEEVSVDLFTDATDLLVRVRNYSRRPAAYTMTIVIAPPGGADGGRTACAPDQVADGGVVSRDAGGGSCVEDTYEPNDTAADAKTLTLDVDGTTNLADLKTCGPDDWFKFAVPAAKKVSVTMDFLHADSDLDLSIHLASDPTSALDFSNGLTNQEVVDAVFFGAAEALVHVKNYSVRPAAYSLTIELTDAECPADRMEENDTAETARLLADAVYDGLTACPGDADHYRFTVPNPGADTLVRVYYDATVGSLRTTITPSGTATPLVTGTHADGMDSLSFTSEANTTYILGVEYTGAGPGNVYAVELARGGFCDDDYSEENDDEASAATLPSYSRTLCENDPDYYKFTAPAGGTAHVQVIYTAALGDVAGKVFTTGAEATPLAELGTYDAVLGGKEAVVNAEQGTTYYVRLVNPAGLGSLSYRLQVTGAAFCQNDDNEPNDTLQTATDMPELTLTDGMLCGGDVDYLKFSLATVGADSRVEVAHPDGAVDVALTTVAGAAVTSVPVTQNGRTVLRFTSVAGTTYAIKLSNPGGTGENSYDVAVFGPPPANDTCATAITLTPPQEVQGTTRQAANDVQFAARNCLYASAGPDVFYRVTIPAHRTVVAVLTSTADLGLYLVDGCDTLCCWAGMDRYASPEVLLHTNPTGSDQTLYLGVDSSSGFREGDFTLQVELLED
jgi:hypothetical protein